jgi:hypothetical protein
MNDETDSEALNGVPSVLNPGLKMGAWGCSRDLPGSLHCTSFMLVGSVFITGHLAFFLWHLLEQFSVLALQMEE